ncbi:hypothetical protein BC938DRAFT_482169 [Jimgerdemannia flammicorona]|uniref:Uncharacterized protein n=1 Tax=Jimgerdemannia flammicorona TaxID=994334 RepID=A0A433R0Q8_9FUNG|nr:hypothetical protein BC938DRAFT_482169 [Jimgerdemannia flammicorona]
MEMDQPGNDLDMEEEDEEDSGNFKAEIIGLITKTCRFRGVFSEYFYWPCPLLHFRLAFGNIPHSMTD